MTNFTEIEKLLAELELTKFYKPKHDKTLHDFPLLATASFVARIKKKDFNDPLLRQILPTHFENKINHEFSANPLAEKKYMPVPGLIHKYPSSVLLLATSNCALNCRFCFRKFTKNIPINWRQVFAYIAKHKNITEVILSGGDPLTLDVKKLNEIINSLTKIKHLERIRIHTRAPIADPNRISKKLVSILAKKSLPVVIVVHCNHPQEINPEVKKAILRLINSGINVLNQSVLLRGVNDNAETLVLLNKQLFALGITPYYLHILDKVKGAAHFYVPINIAKDLIHKMRLKLPGYLIPHLVLDNKNKRGKMYLS